MPTNKKQYSEKYYSEHKDKFIHKEQFCEICKVILKGHLSDHKKTKKHLHYLSLSLNIS